MRTEICSSPRDEFRAINMSQSQKDRCLAPRLENGENAIEARRVDQVCSARPPAENMSDATVMLGAIESGDSKAAEQLLVLVYDELRRLAASKIAQEAPGQTLQPTALV